jgi:hypothetical protein
MSEIYILNGPIDFYFPHPVRYPAQLVVEIRPGGILPSSQYQVIGYGPTATGVTVRYPSAPTDAAHELVISRHTEPERVTIFEDDAGATAAALNAEFDNIYQVLQDLNLEDWRGDWAASTTYEINSVIYGPDDNIYRSTQPHTSGSSFEDDLNAGLWSLIVDFFSAQQQVDASVVLAERWASENEDVEVQDGKFSSKHYSAKSADLASAAASSASAAAASANEAEASLEDFRGRYYGPLASDPTEDPNGNPPTTGDFYFNTTGKIWRIFDGSAWKTASELVNLGTAATRDVGTDADEVPTNADLGTAATRDVGTDADEVPTNADLGTAATLDASSAAMSNTIILRDANGRAQVAAPSASADIARKDTVDAHANSPTPHSGHLIDGILPDEINLNTVTRSGAYRIGNPYYNGPPAGVEYGQLLVIRGGGDTIAQVAFKYNSGNTFVRSGNPPDVGGSGSWTPWIELTSVTVNQSEIENRAVGQGELKTASGSVQTNSNADTLLVLPGGAYGFYPRIYSEDDYHYAKITICGGTDFTINNSPRPLICMNSDNNYNTIANQYYIQASPPYMIGDTLWGHFIFLLRNKNTGAIVAGYEAEDPPWAYNGPAYTRKDSADRIRAVPHPFADYENRDPAEDGLEIILCNTEEVNVGQWRADVERPGRRGSIISEVPAMLTIDEKTPIAAAKNLSIPGFTDRVKLLKARAK